MKYTPFFIKGFLLTSHIFIFGYPMTCSIASWPKLTALNAAIAAMTGDTEACIEPKNIIVSNYCCEKQIELLAGMNWGGSSIPASL